jgi:molybdopterin/thiamine biosynthesis adenylyltransferase
VAPFLLLFVAAILVAIALKAPKSLLIGVASVVVTAIVVGHLVLPDGHPIRAATGETLTPWLFFGGFLAIVLAYAYGLSKLRKRSMGTPQTKSDEFCSVELERYARHIVLREIGGPGQAKLKKARVLVVGAGGLGSPALLYLAAAGVGTIGVVDDDEVSLSNLQRQIIHTDDDIGMPKVFSAQKRIAALNPHVEVLPFNRKIDEDNAVELIGDFDLVLDGSDNFETRRLVNKACVKSGKPLIMGAISQWEGQVSVLDPKNDAPCYACIFPNDPAEGLAPSCAEAGVMGVLPGVIGAMMATEVVKIVCNVGDALRGQMIIYDALYAETRKLSVTRRADCAVCGNWAPGKAMKHEAEDDIDQND